MGNHVIGVHRQLLPEGVRTQRLSGQAGSNKPKPLDAGLNREWAINMALGALVPPKLLASDFAKKLMSSRLPGLGGASTMRKEVLGSVEDIYIEVKEKVAEAKAGGARFVVGADGWKPKMRRRRHYLAVDLYWVDDQWKCKVVTIDVHILRSPRNQAEYHRVVSLALGAVSLSGLDLLCAISDHEGAIRKGLAQLGVPLVGCACHALQLSIKHMLPALTPKKTAAQPAAAAPDGSSSKSSSSSSSVSSSISSESLPASVVPVVAHPKRRVRQRDPEAVALEADLQPVFKRCRSTVKFYQHNEDAYNSLENDTAQLKAQGNDITFVNYDTETKTRWSSAVKSMETVLLNNQAHAMSKIKHGTAAPDALDEHEVQEVLELCTVMEPVRKATDILQGDVAIRSTSLASSYLPVWHQVEQKMQAKKWLIPKRLRPKFGQSLNVNQFSPRALKVMKWLRKDLPAVKTKHLSASTGEELCLAAAYLDIRWKKHGFFTPQVFQRARGIVKRMAVASHKDYPELLRKLEQARKHPLNQPIASLGKGRGRRPRGRGRGQARGRPTSQPTEAGASSTASAEAPVTVRGPALQPFATRGARELRQRTSNEDFMYGEPTKDEVREGEEAESSMKSIEDVVERDLEQYDSYSRDELADPLEFWAAEHQQMPRIALVARWLLGIPASTASLERLFSGAGRAVDRRRPRLRPRNAAKMIYGHSNVRKGVTGFAVWQRRFNA